MTSFAAAAGTRGFVRPAAHGRQLILVSFHAATRIFATTCIVLGKFALPSRTSARAWYSIWRPHRRRRRGHVPPTVGNGFLIRGRRRLGKLRHGQRLEREFEITAARCSVPGSNHPRHNTGSAKRQVRVRIVRFAFQRRHGHFHLRPILQVSRPRACRLVLTVGSSDAASPSAKAANSAAVS